MAATRSVRWHDRERTVINSLITAARVPARGGTRDRAGSTPSGPERGGTRVRPAPAVEPRAAQTGPPGAVDVSGGTATSRIRSRGRHRPRRRTCMRRRASTPGIPRRRAKRLELIAHPRLGTGAARPPTTRRLASVTRRNPGARRACTPSATSEWTWRAAKPSTTCSIASPAAPDRAGTPASTHLSALWAIARCGRSRAAGDHALRAITRCGR